MARFMRGLHGYDGIEIGKPVRPVGAAKIACEIAHFVGEGFEVFPRDAVHRVGKIERGVVRRGAVFQNVFRKMARPRTKFKDAQRF